MNVSYPRYFSYFTQGESPYLNWSWLDTIDMSWIDRINKDRALEKQKRIAEDIAEGNEGRNYQSSSEEIASKSFSDCEFPLSHEWSDSFHAKYKDTISDNDKKIAEIIKTADEAVKIEDLTIFVGCKDGNHYFSTPYHGHGTVELAKIENDSSFDSIDTAVYAFINDYNEWREEHGKKHDTATLLSNLEALRHPASSDDSGCDHEDLGSLGYTHGTTVKCPHCGKMAEVW